MNSFIKKLSKGEPLTIAALGDSLTYGWMVNKGYIEYFRDIFQIKFPENHLTIINSGVPGSTAADGYERLKNDLIPASPELFFIQFALNDAYTGFTPDDFEKNILNIIDLIKKETSADILLITSVTLNNKSEDYYIEQYYDKLEKISIHNKLTIARVHEYWKQKIAAGIDFETLVQDDRVHPTEEGHRLMGEAVMQSILL